jgi:CheY-like chemotaxis protein
MMAKTILLVEDDEDQIFFFERSLRNAGVLCPLKIVRDGEEAINYLTGHGPFADRERFPKPAVVLLDIKLPKVTGLEVLEWIQQNPDVRSFVVIICSSSALQSDIQSAYRLGASSYIVKPGTVDDQNAMAHSFKKWWLEHNKIPLE